MRQPNNWVFICSRCGKTSNTKEDKELLHWIVRSGSTVTRVICHQCQTQDGKTDFTPEEALAILRLKAEYEED